MRYKSAGEYNDSSSDDSRAGGENSLDDYSAAPTAADDSTSEQNGDTGSENRDIVESDIFYVDGTTLYALNRYRGLYVVDTQNPSEMEILGNVAFQGIPTEMYLVEDVAYVLLNPIEDYYYYGTGQTTSRLLAIDVSNPASPIQLNAFDLDGQVSDSRQVGDVIYVVTTGYNYYNSYCTNNSYTSRTLISSIHVGDPSNIQLVDTEEFTSDSWNWTVYVSHLRPVRSPDGRSMVRRGTGF